MERCCICCVARLPPWPVSPCIVRLPPWRVSGYLTPTNASSNPGAVRCTSRDEGRSCCERHARQGVVVVDRQHVQGEPIREDRELVELLPPLGQLLSCANARVAAPAA